MLWGHPIGVSHTVRSCIVSCVHISEQDIRWGGVLKLQVLENASTEKSSTGMG